MQNIMLNRASFVALAKLTFVIYLPYNFIGSNMNAVFMLLMGLRRFVKQNMSRR